ASLAVSPDGKRLAAALEEAQAVEPGRVKLWDAESGRGILTLKGHAGPIAAVAFSYDGKRLVTAAEKVEGQPGEVKVWNAQTGKELLRIKGGTHAIVRLAFSLDGKR